MDNNQWHQHDIMGVVIMELHSSWKWVVLTKLQFNCNELHHIHGELQMSSATQKLSCKASCKTPLFFIMSTISIHKLIQIYLHIFPCNKHTIHVRHTTMTNLMDMEHPYVFPYINEWSKRFHILHYSFKTNCIFMSTWPRL